jgi:hypothetical protein
MAGSFASVAYDAGDIGLSLSRLIAVVSLQCSDCAILRHFYLF